jgi:hypothetical protein
MGKARFEAASFEGHVPGTAVMLPFLVMGALALLLSACGRPSQGQGWEWFHS